MVETVSARIGLESDSIFSSGDLGSLRLAHMVRGPFVATEFIAIKEGAVLPRRIKEVVMLARILPLGRDIAVDDKVWEIVVRNGSRRQKGHEGKGGEVLHLESGYKNLLKTCDCWVNGRREMDCGVCGAFCR